MVIYETGGDFEELENNLPRPPPSEHIETQSLARDQVMDAFVTDRFRKNSLDARYKAVLEEIERLKLEGMNVAPLQHALSQATVSAAAANASTQKNDESHERPESESESRSLNISPKQLNELARIDSRIEALESKLGFAYLEAPIMPTLEALRRKLQLINDNPEQLQKAIEHLNSCQEPLKEGRKVLRAYDILVRVEPLIDQLPAIIQRLKGIEMLHNEADFCQSYVKNLDATLRQMELDIKLWTQKLDALGPKMDALTSRN